MLNNFIKTEPETTDQAAKILQNIKTNLIKLKHHASKQEQDSQNLALRLRLESDRANQNENIIKGLSAAIPSTEQLASCVHQNLTTHIEEFSLRLKQIDEIKDSITDLIKEDRTLTIPPIAPTITQNASFSQTTDRPEIDPVRRVPNHDPSYDVVDECTVIARTLKELHGREIRQLLATSNFTTHVIIMDIQTRYRHVELVCKTTNDAQQLLNEMQQDDRFKEHIKFYRKRKPMHKILILGVPTSYTHEHVKSTILNTYRVPEDEITHLRTTNSRTTGHNNFLFLVPLPLALNIVRRQGIHIGPKTCKVSPFTTVIRCRNCQDYGHTTNSCEYSTYCHNCARKHQEEDCQAPARCINCKLSNRDEHTNYDINHRASDSNCPLYQLHYTYERERLDNFFYGSYNNQTTPQHGAQFTNEDFPTLPHQQQPAQTASSSIPKPQRQSKTPSNVQQEQAEQSAQKIDKSRTTIKLVNRKLTGQRPQGKQPQAPQHQSCSQPTTSSDLSDTVVRSPLLPTPNTATHQLSMDTILYEEFLCWKKLQQMQQHLPPT